MASNFLAKLIPFLSYASMVAVFAWALFDQTYATGFLASTGPMIFLLEFISIHSAPFTFMVITRLHKGVKIASIAGLYAFYSIFVAGFGFAMGDMLAIPYFWFTSAIKIINQWNRVGNEFLDAKYVVSFVVFILLTLGLVFVFSGYCPFSQGANGETLFSSSNEQLSGLNIFAECPQLLALWGVIYFLIMAVLVLLPEGFFKNMFVGTKALKLFAEQHGYSFSRGEEIENLTEKGNSTIGLQGKVAANVVSFKENNESFFVFAWDESSSTTNKAFNYCHVCLIETGTDLNCNILILPLGNLPDFFRPMVAMRIGQIRNLVETKLDNAEFNKNFMLFTDKPSVASKLLTDEVIKHTLEYLKKFRAESAIWGLGKNTVAVCSQKLQSVQEVESLVSYTKELRNYLLKK